MAYSYHGIGYINYGRADERADGTHVTTEWFCILFLPVWPVRRMRIKPGEERPFPGQKMKIGYRVVEVLRLSPGTIVGTYLFTVLCLAWWSATFRFIFMRQSAYLDSQLGMWLAFLALAAAAGLPFGALWLVRREKRRSRYGARRGS